MRRRTLAALALLPLLGATAARAALSVYLPAGELADTAPLVVRGAVRRVASGYDPQRGRLATYVTVAVEEVLRGPVDLTEVVVREPGGRMGDLVHELDAVPVFAAGEEVLLFLEPGRDGALRTSGQFFGKYVVDGERAVRDLSGQGTILRRPEADRESASLDELRAAVADADRNGRRRPRAWWVAQPEELSRLVWDDVRIAGDPDAAGARGGDALAPRPPAAGATPAFAPLSPASPTRWDEADSGTAVVVNVETARNPLGNATAAVQQIRRALQAWTSAPESRLVVQTGNENDAFTTAYASGPADAFPARSIVLFGDPYDDISDPSGCSGTLAIGGYWRSGTLSTTVNGVTFYPARRLYVIFNRNFECFLGNADNLAEVATHEIGHGLGLGHSTVADAVMRSYAYGGARGPRLGADDLDAAHCHYPRPVAVVAPNGGETWTSGSQHTVLWTTPPEAGPDPGTVSIELSTNGGQTWSLLAAGEPDDGAWPWTLPAQTGSALQVRVLRPNRVSPTPAPYPSACSRDASNASFSIVASLAAGTVPGGAAGPPLTVARSGADLVLTWGPSCSGQATDYAVYEGSLAALRAGTWDLVPRDCSTGTDRTEIVSPGSGSRYYLVAALAAGSEGALGTSSSGAPRPAAPAACAPREASSCP